MKISNSIPENGNGNGGNGPSRPDSEPAIISVNISHGVNQHEVSLPSNSRFGHLKSLLAQKIGLNPETHKLLFRGKEKEDDEDFETAGVKDNSKILLVEDVKCTQNCPEEIKEEAKESNVISKGCEAVTEIKAEVDKLAEKVSSLQSAVDSGTKVDEKEIVYLTEMLMRQLLKLDGIEAEGEGKAKRKMEVRRVQGFVDTMDLLKSRNANPTTNPTPTTTQWESFSSDSEIANNHSSPSAPPVTTHVQASNPSPMQSSEPHYPNPSSEPHYHGPSSDPHFPVPSSEPHYPEPSSAHYPVVSHDPPYHVPSSTPYNGPSLNNYPVTSPDPIYPVPSSTPYPGQYSNPYLGQYSDPHQVPYTNNIHQLPYTNNIHQVPYTNNIHQVPYSNPHQVPYSDPHQVHYTMQYPSPYPGGYPSPHPVQQNPPSAYPGQYPSPPYPAPSSNHYTSQYSERSAAPSSPQVTRDWERFD